jgi:hypothetical protein
MLVWEYDNAVFNRSRLESDIGVLCSGVRSRVSEPASQINKLLLSS